MTKKTKKNLSDHALTLIANRFRILAEPMRLKLMHTLGDGEMTVNELVEATQSGQANVSKHLGILLDAGIVARRKSGLNAHYSIADECIFDLCETVCSSLGERLAAQFDAVQSFSNKGK
jgi:ArsR family transcriptional regulator